MILPLGSPEHISNATQNYRLWRAPFMNQPENKTFNLAGTIYASRYRAERSSASLAG
jgi:hypothetical protein